MSSWIKCLFQVKVNTEVKDAADSLLNLLLLTVKIEIR